MSHTNKYKRHRTIARIYKKFKNLAAMVAAATILSAGMIPGIPTATVHAAADPNAGQTPVTASEHINTPNQIGSQADLKGDNPSVTLSNPMEKSNQADKPAQHQSQGKDHQTATSSDKAPDNFKKVLDIKATAYAPGAHDNDQWGDKTFMGTQIRPGIIAVDPSIIPLGSKVYIQYPDGHGEYAVAEDTGGAIKGNRIDIAKTSVDKAQDFGIKNVKVFVLDKANV